MPIELEREALGLLLAHYRKLGPLRLKYRQAELLFRGRGYLADDDVPFVLDVARARDALPDAESRLLARHLWQAVWEKGSAAARVEAAGRLSEGRPAADLARLPFPLLALALEARPDASPLGEAVEGALLRMAVWDDTACAAGVARVSSANAGPELKRRLLAEAQAHDRPSLRSAAERLSRQEPGLCADAPPWLRTLARARAAAGDAAAARAALEAALSAAGSTDEHRDTFLEHLAFLRRPDAGAALEPWIALGLARYAADPAVLSALDVLCRERELPLTAALSVLEAREALPSGALVPAEAIAAKAALFERARVEDEQGALRSVLASLLDRNHAEEAAPETLLRILPACLDPAEAPLRVLQASLLLSKGEAGHALVAAELAGHALLSASSTPPVPPSPHETRLLKVLEAALAGASSANPQPEDLRTARAALLAARLHRRAGAGERADAMLLRAAAFLHDLRQPEADRLRFELDADRRASLREKLEGHPKELDALLDLGRLELEHGRWTEAESAFARCTGLRAGPSNPAVASAPDATTPDATTPDSTTPDAAAPPATVAPPDRARLLECLELRLACAFHAFLGCDPAPFLAWLEGFEAVVRSALGAQTLAGLRPEPDAAALLEGLALARSTLAASLASADPKRAEELRREAATLRRVFVAIPRLPPATVRGRQLEAAETADLARILVLLGQVDRLRTGSTLSAVTRGADPADRPPVGSRDRFRPERTVARGQDGESLLCRDAERDGRAVLVKVFRRAGAAVDAVSGVDNLRAVLVAFDGVGVARTQALGGGPGWAWSVRDFVEGVSLEDFLRRFPGVLPLADRLSLFARMCGAAASMDGAPGSPGLPHGALHAGNCILSPDLRSVTLTDGGLTGLREHGGTASEPVAGGAARRADVRALGRLLAFLLSEGPGAPAAETPLGRVAGRAGEAGEGKGPVNAFDLFEEAQAATLAAVPSLEPVFRGIARGLAAGRS